MAGYNYNPYSGNSAITQMGGTNFSMPWPSGYPWQSARNSAISLRNQQCDADWFWQYSL